ncbi:Oxa1p [Kockiozyma suomiensis]|uniref:Oxa1p n=1 Tax=Kockiozyma suomiensis TaxID=1337062 RepID=UPI0033440BA1
MRLSVVSLTRTSATGLLKSSVRARQYSSTSQTWSRVVSSRPATRTLPAQSSLLLYSFSRTFFSKSTATPPSTTETTSEFASDKPQQPELASHELTSSTSDSLDFANQVVTDNSLVSSDTLQVIQSSSDAVGTLQSLGLAKTWIYPTDICQHLLENMHVLSGLPWWAAIVLTTVACRVLLFPIYVKASDMTARTQKMQPALVKLTEDFAKQGGSAAEFIVSRRQLMDEYGVKQRWIFAPMLVNLCYGLGMFLGLMHMAGADVPGFNTEGTLWFPNLNDPDRYLGLQIIAASSFTLLFQLGGETGINTLSPGIKRLMLTLPFVSIFFTMSLPAGVILYFCTTSFITTLQSMLLRSLRFRKMTHMTPLVKPSERPSTATQNQSFQKQWEMMVDAAKRAAKEQEQKPKP